MLGVKKLEGKEDPSDYIFVADLYAKLWLSERKPYGLDRILSHFWGAAAKRKYNIP